MASAGNVTSELTARLGDEVVSTSLSLKGRRRLVPTTLVDGRLVFVSSRLVRLARIHDEAWMDTVPVPDPAAFIHELKRRRFPADIFTFGPKYPDVTRRFDYYTEWDNVAAVELADFSAWWDALPQESRKNVRKSAKQGVQVVRTAPDSRFAEGVTNIYNETPVRQGRRFSKYGMTVSAVAAELSLLASRSDFIGAYFGEELIGFIKLVYLGDVASILSIVAKNGHADKKTTNALIAKAVEFACARGMKHLLYGKYVYGNKQSSPMTEFKRRNGFVQVPIPRYYVPLTLRGGLMTRMRLHRGMVGLLPDRISDLMLRARAVLLSKRA